MKLFFNIPLQYVFGSWCLLAILLSSSRPVSNQEKYIDQFKDLAISEMERTGIPASIKMAQALLESQSGLSELALNANNHFGIKCKSEWTGDIYYYHDDDKDDQGKIIASCFRSYSSAWDSYKDHSDFLVNRSRYKELFKLDKTDYVNWAYGLKKCGYATDPIYSERLIKLIQKYELDQLDKISDKKDEKENLVTINQSNESRIYSPVEPIISKEMSLTVKKSIPRAEKPNVVKHKSKQKHKRKRRK